MSTPPSTTSIRVGTASWSEPEFAKAGWYFESLAAGYMVARFGGGAAGSALGALVGSWAKWPGVCVFCLGLSFVALLVHFIGLQRGARVGHRSSCPE